MQKSEKCEPVRPEGASAGSINVSRRGVMKGLALAAMIGELGRAVIAEAATAPAASGSPRVSPATGDMIKATDSNPVVKTQYGRVRGYIRNGINTFKGIPYGADTFGANRFMPPRKPEPWDHVMSCMYHGYVSPQGPRDGWAFNEVAWLFGWDDGIQSEDCFNLNVWTPALDDGKRPVMVWLHGGGFAAGSATELPSYDGENLARRGVVLVSVTHRLNVMGFLNLAAYDDKYALSGNAGMLDIVAALEWVRDNISRFGGDPSRVTIFGQSGGGGKVSTLMAMPAAKGLFHRAIVESGSMMCAATMESSHTLAEKLLKQVNVGASDLEKLQQMPFPELQKAAAAAAAFHMPASGVLDFRQSGAMMGWMPVCGNTALPEPPFDPKAPEISASVPMIVGTCLNEFITAMNKPDAFEMTAAELETNVRNLWKDKADNVLKAFRKSFPNANNFQLWSVIGTSSVRAVALDQVRCKSAQKSAPAYCYRFDWQPPVLGGRPMAFHCAELAFVFDNSARCENMTGNGAAAHALAAKMSEAWVHFARTGDPQSSGASTLEALRSRHQRHHGVRKRVRLPRTPRRRVHESDRRGLRFNRAFARQTSRGLPRCFIGFQRREAFYAG
jgi:para-nitrobenzyl esterase